MKKLFFVLFLLFALCISLFAMFFGGTNTYDGYFTYAIKSNPETLDPAKMSGILEGYLAECVFEGLLNANPSGGKLPEECMHLKPENWTEGQPLLGVAKSYDISEDMLTYTFHLRDTNWIKPDGEIFRPVTAQDFVWSWKRVLDPVNASPYAQLIFVIENAENYYNKKFIDLIIKKKSAGSDVVRIELSTMMNKDYYKSKIESAWENAQAETDEKKAEIRDAEFMSMIESVKRGGILADGQIKSNYLVLSGVKPKDQLEKLAEPAFKALDDKTVQVSLKYVTPYFLDLCSFHTMLPSCKENFEAEKHPAYIEELKNLKTLGDEKNYNNRVAEIQSELEKRWWSPENLIYNGCYKLDEWAFSRQIVFKPSEKYWDREHVMNKGIHVRVVTDSNTGVNLFYSDELDFVDDIPPSLLEKLAKKDENGKPTHPEFHSDEYLASYYYKFNVKRKPFDNVWLRRAINASIDRETICREMLDDLCLPATGFVAKGIPNYPEFKGIPYDKELMQIYLDKSGFKASDMNRPVSLLYNTSEGHKKRAIIIQEQILQNMNIKIDLRNMEWKSYLSATRKLDYDIARAGWIGDYVDPMTFMDMFITGGGNNNTGFSNKRYDNIILTYIPDIYNYLNKSEMTKALIADIEEYEKRAFAPDTWLIMKEDKERWREFFTNLKNDVQAWKELPTNADKLNSSQDIRLRLFQWAEHILCYDECVIIPLYYYLNNVIYDGDRLKGIYKNLRCHMPRRWIRPVKMSETK